MATYVNNLRLKEIATGDESGTWGTSTNTNLELIGEALGVGTEAITTNADTHDTIVADGVADEGIFSESTGTADAMEGFVLVKPSAAESASVTAFQEAYAEAYPDASGDIYTGETYDAVKAGALAVKAGASTAGADIIANLGAVSFDGATGAIGFDANGDSTAGFYQVSKVAAGAISAVATWTSAGLSWSDADFQSSWSASSSSGLPFPGAGFIFSLFAVAILARRKFN